MYDAFDFVTCFNSEMWNFRFIFNKYLFAATNRYAAKLDAPFEGYGELEEEEESSVRDV